jgi:hypothetical protein
VDLAQRSGARLHGSSGRPDGADANVAAAVALLGGAVGAAVGAAAVLYGPVGDVLSDHFGTPGAIIGLGLMGALVLGSMVGAVWLRYRHQRDRARVAAGVGALCLTGGTLGLVAAVAFAHRYDYPTDTTSIGVEVALVAIGCLLAMALGQRLVPGLSRQPARSRP